MPYSIDEGNNIIGVGGTGFDRKTFPWDLTIVCPHSGEGTCVRAISPICRLMGHMIDFQNVVL
jgi:hypothetical protein